MCFWLPFMHFEENFINFQSVRRSTQKHIFYLRDNEIHEQEITETFKTSLSLIIAFIFSSFLALYNESQCEIYFMVLVALNNKILPSYHPFKEEKGGGCNFVTPPPHLLHCNFHLHWKWFNLQHRHCNSINTENINTVSVVTALSVSKTSWTNM